MAGAAAGGGVTKRSNRPECGAAEKRKEGAGADQGLHMQLDGPGRSRAAPGRPLAAPGSHRATPFPNVMQERHRQGRGPFGAGPAALGGIPAQARNSSQRARAHGGGGRECGSHGRGFSVVPDLLRPPWSRFRPNGIRDFMFRLHGQMCFARELSKIHASTVHRPDRLGAVHGISKPRLGGGGGGGGGGGSPPAPCTRARVRPAALLRRARRRSLPHQTGQWRIALGAPCGAP